MARTPKLTTEQMLRGVKKGIANLKKIDSGELIVDYAEECDLRIFIEWLLQKLEGKIDIKEYIKLEDQYYNLGIDEVLND